MNKPIVPRQIRRVFEGRILTVSVESITLPRGERLEAEVVRHPGSVVLIPVTDRGEIVLVRQYRHAIGRSVWELPAGSLEPGEDPRAAAARECHEEIGLIPSAVERLGAFFPTPGDPARYQALASFVTLGINHVRSGTDHLSFVLCLLIPFSQLRPLVAFENQ